jgi:hypothetical protein
MAVYTLGPDKGNEGPFAEVCAANELEARRKVQAIDSRRNWLDIDAIYCLRLGAESTRDFMTATVKLYERFEDLPPAKD